MAKVAVSLLFADFKKINEWLPALEAARPEMFQWDFMDNEYVPNSGNRVEDLKFLRPKTKIFFDCHLMLKYPLSFIERLEQFGADSATFHVETVRDPLLALKKIRNAGLGVGIAVNNGVKAERILPFLEHADIALVMGVQAGFGGQKFLPAALDKVRVLREKIDEEGLDCKIQVDGGINLETGKMAVEAGADILVAGSFVLGHKNPKEAVLELKKL